MEDTYKFSVGPFQYVLLNTIVDHVIECKNVVAGSVFDDTDNPLLEIQASRLRW